MSIGRVYYNSDVDVPTDDPNNQNDPDEDDDVNDDDSGLADEEPTE